jgi:long-chain acyl-CoA synthetase
VAGEDRVRRLGLARHDWKDEGDSQDLVTGDGWLPTGDLATRNRLGLIRLVGGKNNVIKSGGHSVYVRELEEAMLAHPAGARGAAFDLPHNEKGEVPVAAVELSPGSSSNEAGLLNWCRSHPTAYSAPRRIWIADPGNLPQNYTGKLLRPEFQERFRQLAD